MSKIAVIGIVGESVFMTVPKHQAVGETASASSIHREWGGKGYNQAVAAARFGADVAFLGAVANEDIAEVSALSGEVGVRAFLVGSDIPSAYGVIVTDDTGDNRVTVYGGAALTAEDVGLFKREIETADILLLSNEVPEAVNVEAVKIAKENGVTVILNPAPVRSICPYLMKNVDLFTPNEHEAEAIGERKNTVTTLGARGALIAAHNELIPAIDAGEVVDTTGAGDTFSGTLAAALAEGMMLRSACRVANAAAAIEVTRRYVMPAIPSRDEVLALTERTRATYTPWGESI